MGIPHFEDLTPADLYEIIKDDLVITSKLDGSFIAFGYDADMRFYTERKSGQRYYSVEEWPLEGWCNGFRQAHVVLENYLERLHVAWNKAGRYARSTCEIIWGHQPNVVEYGAMNRILLHDNSNFSPDPFECNIGVTQLKSDGRKAWTVREDLKWSIQAIRTKKYKLAKEDIKGLLEWLDRPSIIAPYTRREVLEFKLNRRPTGYTKEAWQTTMPLIKAERELLRDNYFKKMTAIRKEILAYLNSHLYFETITTVTLGEGFVCVGHGGVIFKLINREWFKPANDFVHRARYALIGGRRPARSSFESRTRNWPLDKRLKRLEVLRRRYLVHHHKLKFTYNGGTRLGDLSYSDEIHDRVLMLFYDLRERLKDGRAGVQGEHSANLPGGDSSNITVAGPSVKS